MSASIRPRKTTPDVPPAKPTPAKAKPAAPPAGKPKGLTIVPKGADARAARVESWSQRSQKPGAPTSSPKRTSSSKPAASLTAVPATAKRAVSRNRIEFTPKLGVVAILAVAIAIVQLVAFRQRNRGVSIDPTYSASSLRWAVAFTSLRVDDYMREYHRAPNALTEIGDHPWAEITYDKVDFNRYRLTAPGPTSPIVYDSIDPRDGFLGKSRSFLGPPTTPPAP